MTIVTMTDDDEEENSLEPEAEGNGFLSPARGKQTTDWTVIMKRSWGWVCVCVGGGGGGAFCLCALSQVHRVYE